MKSLILAAGRGKRLGELTVEKNKCMVEVGGKPLISYSLDCASKIPQVSEIVVVVGYQAQEIQKNFKNEYNSKPIKYVIQGEQKGLVHAIECAKEAIGKDDFILMLGDELMVNPNHTVMVNQFEKENLDVVCGIVQVSDPNLISKTYGIRTEKSSGTISVLIEKPSYDDIKKASLIEPNIMGTGNCIFKNDIFSYIPKTRINPNRGEKELPDLITTAIKYGKIVKPITICDRYFNVNFKEEIQNAGSHFIHFSESDNKSI